MSKKHPVERARERGHNLVDDPPAHTLTNMNRQTCSKCGRAVLWGPEARHGYGTALEKDCVAS
jgi:hypothetical protein